MEVSTRRWPEPPYSYSGRQEIGSKWTGRGASSAGNRQERPLGGRVAGVESRGTSDEPPVGNDLGAPCSLLAVRPQPPLCEVILRSSLSGLASHRRDAGATDLSRDPPSPEPPVRSDKDRNFRVGLVPRPTLPPAPGPKSSPPRKVDAGSSLRMLPAPFVARRIGRAAMGTLATRGGWLST